MKENMLTRNWMYDIIKVLKVSICGWILNIFWMFLYFSLFGGPERSSTLQLKKTPGNRKTLQKIKKKKITNTTEVFLLTQNVTEHLRKWHRWTLHFISVCLSYSLFTFSATSLTDPPFYCVPRSSTMLLYHFFSSSFGLKNHSVVFWVLLQDKCTCPLGVTV